MNKSDYNKGLTIMIDFVREIANMLEAIQSRVEESFCIDGNIILYIANHPDDVDVQTLHNIFEKAKTEDQSIEDNISFMLGSIHKRIGKYKRTMKDTTSD
ncbi:unnamed protein product [Lactuca saligna]|uniref:Uncharacterized protein n=1 Tax=Lactuca saligna TaxID=75948 RepID=A0AA35Z5T8_LACSI|nr:unnamed protein product [Lactuca saligna]